MKPIAYESRMRQIALDIGLATAPSFANFFAGPNQAVLMHLKLWTGSHLNPPVPTYLWGEPGCGKTHLLKAAAGALQSQGARIGWLDAASIEPPEFHNAWTAIVLDQCHLYSAVQQQVAFNWFVNAVSSTHDHPCGVLAAGNVPPADLKLRDDLRSRLGWGHVYELQLLSEPERRGVLRAQAEARGIFLSDEVIGFVLSRFSRDLSSLMHLLDQLDDYALQAQRAITVPLLKAMLENQ